jgi:hypothetical protein
MYIYIYIFFHKIQLTVTIISKSPQTLLYLAKTYHCFELDLFLMIMSIG